MQEPRITIICGHYGSGKTNFSVNLALQQAAAGGRTAIADLDIVNPYFRTADHAALFARHGIELIAPRYANSNLDLPVLPSRLASAIGEKSLRLVVDLGGDDDGAVALGGFAQRIAAEGYRMLYVINRSRYLEEDPESELVLLRGIERCARLQVTGLVNNTNLGGETTPALIESSRAYVQEIAHRAGLPVVCTVAARQLAAQLAAVPDLFPADIYVKTPWQAPMDEGGNDL